MIHYKSLDYPVDIGICPPHDVVMWTCTTIRQVKRTIINHEYIAFYNYIEDKKNKNAYPANQWLIFKVVGGKKFGRSLTMLLQNEEGKFKLPYQFVNAQKDAPNPRKLTLLKNLALIH